MKPRRRLKRKVKEFLYLLLCSGVLILLVVLLLADSGLRREQEQETLVLSESLEQEIIPKADGQMVVVIDPAGGSDQRVTVNGCSEGELTLQIAGLLQEKITEPAVRVYFTRTNEHKTDKEEILQFVWKTEADLFLQLGVAEAEETSRYGVSGCYNEEYVIPEFGNAQWADLVLEKVAIASVNRAVSLENAGEDSILRQLEIPSMRINLGFFSNAQEALLLQQEEYQHKLAQGIADAISEAYTENYEKRR